MEIIVDMESESCLVGDDAFHSRTFRIAKCEKSALLRRTCLQVSMWPTFGLSEGARLLPWSSREAVLHLFILVR